MSKTRSRRPSSRSARRSNSSVASPACSSRRATIRLRGLWRLLPLPWAKITSPRRVRRNRQVAAQEDALEIDHDLPRERTRGSRDGRRRRLSIRLGQQRDDLVVRDLCEIPVPASDAVELAGDGVADHLVGRPPAAARQPDASRRGPPRRSALPRAPRSARTAARSVRPVARPSSTTMTVLSWTSRGVRPSRKRSIRRLSSCRSRARIRSNSSWVTPRRRAVAESTTAVPSSATAPMANSGFSGAPSLRTVRTSSGAPSTRATSAATGTPPRGSATTIGRSAASGLRRSASCRPASWRSSNILSQPWSPTAPSPSAGTRICLRVLPEGRGWLGRQVRHRAPPPARGLRARRSQAGPTGLRRIGRGKGLL